MIHITVNLGRCRSVLCCTCSVVFRLCPYTCTWPQDKLSQLIVTEEPTGSSCLVPAITPPAWSCLYLKCSKTSSCGHPLWTELFSSKKNCIISWMTKKEELLHRQDLYSVPRENPFGVCPMLHECRVPSTWRDISFTCYVYASSYSILLKQLFYETICCWTFLIGIQEEPCTVSLPLAPQSHHRTDTSLPNKSKNKIINLFQDSF